MKKSIKKWALRLLAFILISGSALLGAVLNPVILYAHETKIGNFTVYHQRELADDFYNRLDRVHDIVAQSELYDSTLKVEICLNDGSIYPDILKPFLPPAFGWSISDKAVFQGTSNYKENTVRLNGYNWNLEQLYAHEVMHCYQFNYFGPLNANPIGGHPNWKWEGYAEYASRKEENQRSLVENIKRIEAARSKAPDEWGVFFEDETAVSRTYYDYWLLMQYCLDIRNMTYEEVIRSEIARTSVEEEMNNWYRLQVENF